MLLYCFDNTGELSFDRIYLSRLSPRHAFIEASPLKACVVELFPVEPPASVQQRKSLVTRTEHCPLPVVTHEPDPSHLFGEPVEALLFVVDFISPPRQTEHVATTFVYKYVLR